MSRYLIGTVSLAASLVAGSASATILLATGIYYVLPELAGYYPVGGLRTDIGEAGTTLYYSTDAGHPISSMFVSVELEYAWATYSPTYPDIGYGSGINENDDDTGLECRVSTSSRSCTTGATSGLYSWSLNVDMLSNDVVALTYTKPDDVNEPCDGTFTAGRYCRFGARWQFSDIELGVYLDETPMTYLLSDQQPAITSPFGVSRARQLGAYAGGLRNGRCWPPQAPRPLRSGLET